MVARIAIRQTGKKLRAYVTTAGSVARGKKLAKHPVAVQAQKCISANAGDRTAIRKCMQSIKK